MRFSYLFATWVLCLGLMNDGSEGYPVADGLVLAEGACFVFGHAHGAELAMCVLQRGRGPMTRP